MAKHSNRKRLTALRHDTLVRTSYLLRALRLVWRSSGGWTTAWAALLILQGLLPAAIVYLTKRLVDGLAAAVDVGVSPESVQLVLVPALLMAGVLLVQEVLRGALEWVRTAQAELVKDHVSALIHRKAYSVDLAFYEASDSYNQLHRARESAENRTLDLVENLGSLAQNAITLVAMAVILIPYGVWVPLALIISMLPALYVVLHFNQRYHRWWEQATPDQRRARYYDWLLTYSEAAAEIRLFKLGPRFGEAYRILRKRLRDEHLRLIKHQGLARLGAGAAALLVTGAILAWMGWRAIQGTATLGDIALFYQAFNQGQGLMRTLMRNLGQIYGNSLFLGNLFQFLDVKPVVLNPSNPLPAPVVLKQGIRFQDVTFHYPGREQAALQQFNLTLPAGKTVAIVGANGAGKSTLIKLLCRFYDPDAGRIEFDGTDIRNFAIEELQRRIAVLFQFPVRYHETAAQNIEVGDLSNAQNSAETAARAAGAHEVILRLANGYNTHLGRWFWEGTELSGGEWQRIALARAFFRAAPIVILDEPTSFMDSWMENEWLNRFRRLVRGRTALIITHRFTTAMRADIIHVMREGQVVESGTHEELMAQNGLYAQSWKAQIQAGFHPSVESEDENYYAADESREG